MSNSNPVKGALLLSELTGNDIGNDDYLGRAAIALERMNYNKPPVQFNSSSGVRWSDRNILLRNDFDEGKHDDVCTKFADGTWYISTKQIMNNCNSDMIYWWFNYCDDTEKYRWWHPRKNIQGIWDPQ